MQDYSPIKHGQHLLSGLVGVTAGLTFYQSNPVLINSIWLLLFLWQRLPTHSARFMWFAYFLIASSSVFEASALFFKEAALSYAIITLLGATLIMWSPIAYLSIYVKKYPFQVHIITFFLFSLPFLPFGYIGWGSPHLLSALAAFPISPYFILVLFLPSLWLITQDQFDVDKSRLAALLAAIAVGLNVFVVDKGNGGIYELQASARENIDLIQKVSLIDEAYYYVTEHPDVTAVLFPESFIRDYDEAFINSYISNRLWMTNVIAGVDLPTKFGDVIFENGRETQFFHDRFPVPLGVWPKYDAYPMQHHYVTFNRKKIGLAICFEITSPMAILPMLVMDDMIAANANMWFAGDGYFTLKKVQGLHRNLYARIKPVAYSKVKPN